jgi:hypothetical protein
VGDEEKPIANIGGKNFDGLVKRFKKCHWLILAFSPCALSQ